MKNTIEHERIAAKIKTGVTVNKTIYLAFLRNDGDGVVVVEIDKETAERLRNDMLEAITMLEEMENGLIN